MFRKPKPASQQPRPRGDTILSVMISVVIIGSVMGTTYHLINSSLRLGRSAQERGHAINVINIQIERLKAVLDLEPDRIFKDPGMVLSTPPPPTGGFGRRFCLTLDKSASTAAIPPRPIIDIRVDASLDTADPNHPDPTRNILHADCQGVQIGFPVPNAEPRVEIRYQETNLSNTNDTNRFEIKIFWTAIGSSRTEELTAYYRSHPLLLRP